MIREMVDINGVNVCPKCHKREFTEFHTDRGCTYILDYNVAPENKRNEGAYEFVYQCANCKIKIKEYRNLSKKIARRLPPQ